MWNQRVISMAMFFAMSCVIHYAASFQQLPSLVRRSVSLTSSFDENDPSVVEPKEKLAIAPLWRAGYAEFNVAEKWITLYNVTIDNPNNEIEIEGQEGRVEALRVERLKVCWDNFWYTTRTFEVELENTEALIEFINLKAAKSNWDEILEKDFYEWLMAEVDEKGNKYDEEGFFHFSSIALMGNLTLRLASRPLGTTLGSITMNASASQVANSFNKKIGERSEENLRRTNRKGVMFAELSDIMKEYLDELILEHMPSVFKRKG